MVAAQAVLTAEPAGFVLVGQPVTGPPSAATSSVPSGSERAAAAGGGADEPPAQPVVCTDDIAVQQMLLDDAASPDSRAGGNIVDPSSDGPFLCAAGTFCQLPSVPVPELKHLCRGCQRPLHGLCGAPAPPGNDDTKRVCWKCWDLLPGPRPAAVPPPSEPSAAVAAAAAAANPASAPSASASATARPHVGGTKRGQQVVLPPAYVDQQQVLRPNSVLRSASTTSRLARAGGRNDKASSITGQQGGKRVRVVTTRRPMLTAGG